MPDSKITIILGVTGSVAAVKAPELAIKILQEIPDAALELILSVGGKHFWDRAASYDPTSWQRLSDFTDRITIHQAQDEWQSWNVLGDPVAHIELRNRAQLLLIAPLSAHTLAKLANGLCDDTLTCVARAWKPEQPMILAPAMNTAMWDHVLTGRQLATVRGFGNVRVIEPVSKLLACGEMGNGALASVDDIVLAVQEAVL